MNIHVRVVNIENNSKEDQLQVTLCYPLIPPVTLQSDDNCYHAITLHDTDQRY